MWLHIGFLLPFSFILMNLPHYGYFQSSHSTTCYSPCPIDGGWTAYGEWSEWSQCSNSRFCAGSVKNRRRSRRCTNPSPLYGGKDCYGPQVEIETKPCNFLECVDYCICIAWGGGPHYLTPDGAVIHFHENCKYTLWKSTADEQCAFKIEVKNERRYGDTRVSYTRMVDFYMGRTQIRILPNGKTLINGTPVSIPATTSNNTIEIARIGYFVTIDHVECGIRVHFDGVHHVDVIVSKNRFSGNLTGLCGNCNGKADDDYRTKSGKIGKFVDIGNSYKVLDDSDKPDLKCNDDLEVSQPNMSSHFKSNDGFWSWGPWDEWGSCSATCESGTQKRVRLNKCVEPKYSGKPCPREPRRHTTIRVCYSGQSCPDEYIFEYLQK